jgi:hypothetical protein
MRKTSVLQSALPVFASNASVRSDSPTFVPSVSAEVRKIFPPAIAGDDQPSPGTGIFHATFFVASQ